MMRDYLFGPATGGSTAVPRVPETASRKTRAV